MPGPPTGESSALLGEELFEEVVSVSGFPTRLARGLLRRSLAAVGAEIETARPQDYRQCLASIRARMKVYIPIDQVDERVERLRELLGE